MSKTKRITVHRLLLVLQFFIIFFFTFVVRETLEVRHSGNRGISLTPFRELIAMFRDPNHVFYFWQIALNIFLFVPFGILAASYIYLYMKKRKVREIFLMVFISGFLLSFSVELFQYITSRGYSEIDDILNNTLGTVIGCLIVIKLIQMKNSNKNKDKAS